VAWRWKRLGTPGKRPIPQQRPESEWVRLPDGLVPAIVSSEMWQQAHAAMAANHGEATRNQARPSLLRGHIWCAVCRVSEANAAYAREPEHDARPYDLSLFVT
jgi:hypothetical protein